MREDETQRPDPDALLRELRMGEDERRQGSLKVFFGAAPGVGKTYAMLEAARQRQAEGVDVVAGLIESHGRVETEALLVGIELLPRRQVEYRGTTLSEFDLDAALSRRPDLLLIDELAHNNAPDSRHKKRWQDVFELLSSGIDVYTTLNVQHLESLNDVVRQITGVIVRETVPDSVLDRADEIGLVDLPPDELLRRLHEGKVYVAELAGRAREHFFRKGNLLALRELALRRTAERVDAQMETYRRAKGVREVWPASDRIMVCVGPNPRSIRLIRAARRMAAGLRADWLAVHVEAPSKVRPSPDDIRRLGEHMRLAESLGAETVSISGHRASDDIMAYARSRNVTKLIIGKPTHPRWKDRVFGSLLDEVVRGSGDIDVYVITGDSDEEAPRRPGAPSSAPFRGNDWLLSLAGVMVTTGAALLLARFLEVVDIAMLFLLGVVFSASRGDRLLALVTTLLGVASFNFFFVSPYFTFVVGDSRYLVTFGVMAVVALVISSLTRRIRQQIAEARQREWRTASLYSLSRELVHEQEVERISVIVIRHLGGLFSCRAVVLVPDRQGHLVIPVTGPETYALDPHETSVAQWSFDHRERAGRGTDTLPAAQALYLPLVTASRPVGVLGILNNASPEAVFDQDQLHVLEGFANQAAMAIERTFLAEEAHEALLKAETETLRNTLLSSVSHDLRTPLAAITGAATSLVQQDIVLDQNGRRELVQTIYEEAEHLNQIIRNVLDMTRLESGTIRVTKEWQSVEEIIGAVLTRFAERLGDRRVATSLPPDLPLVPFDPLLIEQVLANLLDNAMRYSPAGTPLDLAAYHQGQQLVIEFADRGPGLGEGQEERIFEKFVRGHAGGGGVGLGLAICRAIVNAHGGRIWAENRAGGGAVFRFTLPLGTAPPLPAPEEEEAEHVS
ncbi:MAG: two-component system sensor histidine kinase KdbD [Desulfobulbaceae bacterium A2]|nr:MAG: two-component system sensor histidine kinase KdbD [Desulfobulbaceae bacterium A2]